MKLRTWHLHSSQMSGHLDTEQEREALNDEEQVGWVQNQPEPRSLLLPADAICGDALGLVPVAAGRQRSRTAPPTVLCPLTTLLLFPGFSAPTGAAGCNGSVGHKVCRGVWRLSLSIKLPTLPKAPQAWERTSTRRFRDRG